MYNRNLRKYLKRVIREFPGVSSYTTGGFEVTIGELKKVVRAIVKYGGNGEYIAQLAGIDGNKVKIFVRDNIEQEINEAGTATVTVGAEIAAGTDISGEKFIVEAEGY